MWRGIWSPCSILGVFGKLVGCFFDWDVPLLMVIVVLLDESDVFLEEREKTDLQRNALVSVFLRVLEYYEGILILTSNRGMHTTFRINMAS